MVQKLHLNAEEQNFFVKRKTRVTTNAVFLPNYYCELIYRAHALLQKRVSHFNLYTLLMYQSHVFFDKEKIIRRDISQITQKNQALIRQCISK